ncbi:MAG: amidohydrolase family protein [Chitinophagaceae bacterium]
MLRIDAHQHFWKYNAQRDGWISDEMSLIRRDFMPEDLQPLLVENEMDGCVVVQSDQSEIENMFHLESAAKHDFIKGVVGWVDLTAGDIAERLHGLSQFKHLKGFRNVLQAEPGEFMLKPEFMQGISALQQTRFTYDLLILPNQLSFAKHLVAAFPDQRFVIDHMAKPYIRDRKVDDWKKDMGELAQYDNVWCKASGMVTEADWKEWKNQDFTPYLDVIFELFGPKRVLFGSDWPVCLVAASYSQVVEILAEYMAGFSVSEQIDFWGGNASKFYNLI